MSVYPLSRILSHDFSSVPLEDFFDLSNVTELPTRLVFGSSKKMTHYGATVFEQLDKLLPQVWTKATTSSDRKHQQADLDNTNKNHLGIVWYLDGMKDMTLKHNLPMVSSYAITKDDRQKSDSGEYQATDHTSKLWIQKPSHEYLGSGRFITINGDVRILEAERPKTFFLGKQEIPITNWVIQPLLPSLLWRDRKFDCRFYSVVYTIGDQVYAAAYKYGIARLAVNRYDPLNDTSSAITNISVQEQLTGYSVDSHMPLIRDDLDITHDMLREMVENIDFKITEPHHLLILGLDVMFLPDGTGKLIEVNHEPHLELFASNAERICSRGIVAYIFGQLVPSMIEGRQFSENPDWTYISK